MSIEADVGARAASGAGGDSSAERILVVARSVPVANRTFGDRRIAQLLSDLAAVVDDGRLTLLAPEGHAGRPAARLLRRKGIEVVAGPVDWDEWLRRRSLSYSHVILTDLVGFRRFAPVLGVTQPQARRVLFLPDLDLPQEESASAIEERAGARLLAGHVRDQLTAAAQAVDAAWCATEHDRAWLAAAAPRLRTAVVPTTTGPRPPAGFASRSGYVVLGAPGADLSAGHEESALHAARDLLPELVARDPSAFLRIVVDEPSPAVQLLAGPHVELVAAGDDPARWFLRSRVCLAWYPTGGGHRLAAAVSLDTGTPFVTSSRGMLDVGLPALPCAADDHTSACLLADQLHQDERLWTEVQGTVAAMGHGPRSSSAGRRAVIEACADLGIAPRPGTTLEEPLARATPAAERPVRPRKVPVVGSAWKAAPPAPDGPLPPGPDLGPEGFWWDEIVNDQYERWVARYGPTQERLARLRRRLAGLVRRPRISIVMPVFNTEPAWLDEAISSVRSQVYEHWELCVADDGSSEVGTMETLRAHERTEARLRVVRLPSQQGIAAASNAALSLATGDFVGFLDHDDQLKPHTLGEIALALEDDPELDLLYTDEDKRDVDGRLVDPFFKPDWSPDHLMSRNYVCHLLVLRRTLLEKLGGFRLGYDGSQDYDLVLRATEVTNRIAHVAEPLYTWRKVAGSTAANDGAKPWAVESARRALADAMVRRGVPGQVVDGMYPNTYRAHYALRGRPRVSILIPTRDKGELLRACIESIVETSTYANYELVVVDNESVEPETLGYLATLPGRVVRFPHRFNYSRMMNLAAHEATGDVLLFLNNDTEVRSPEWIEALLEHGQRPEVGIVGARLLYPDGKPQHEGIIVGYKGGHAGNVFHGGYWGLGDIVRNCSAVTGACLLVRAGVYWELGGHDERLGVAYNDVDLCLRARQAGYEVVYTPYAELVHVEGGTRGIHTHVMDDDSFEAHWVTHKCLDPYYNANFERRYPFRIRS